MLEHLELFDVQRSKVFEFLEVADDGETR